MLIECCLELKCKMGRLQTDWRVSVSIITGRMRRDIEKFMRCFPDGVSQSVWHNGAASERSAGTPRQSQHSGPVLSC